jgi:adenylate kinase
MTRYSRKQNRSAACLAMVVWAAMALPAHAAGPVVLLVGPPASGRSTQASMLGEGLKMTVIATDDLINKNKQRFQKYRNPAIQGVDPHLDPVLNTLVEEALKSADLSNGVILDGYPASTFQADHLARLREKLNLPRAIVIHLNVPDEVVRQRLKDRKREDLEQELKDYHREFDFVRQYFPQSDIRTVDGTKTRDEIAREIRNLLQTPPQ